MALKWARMSVIGQTGQRGAMPLGDCEKALEELLRLGTAADSEEIDQLNEQARAAFTGPPHCLDQPGEAWQEAIMADAQERSARHVADAGRLDHDRARHAACEALVPVDDLLGDVAVSVARHGTMAGTQVRCASDTGPISIGENSRDAAASAADGIRPAEAVNLIRCGGRHTVLLRIPARSPLFISYGARGVVAKIRWPPRCLPIGL